MFPLVEQCRPDIVFPRFTSFFLELIGTMRDAKDHLQNCVYERFKGYIVSTNKRFEKLESLLSVSTLPKFVKQNIHEVL